MNVQTRPPTATEKRDLLISAGEAYLEKYPAEADGVSATEAVDRMLFAGALAPATQPCLRCGSHFTPRSGSGGRPQRFCSPDCKSAFHAQRRQRAPTCSAQTASDDRAKADAPADVSEDFDWQDPDAVVLPEQQAVAAYLTVSGALVIRQAGWPDDDHVIVIGPANVAAFIDKLTDIIGIPTMGR